jgi:hypothetical protein
VSLPRHIREAGLRAVVAKLGEIITPTLGSLKAQKTKQLGGLPDANLPKVVSFPSSS